jgi:hypothetical protein
LRDARPEDGAAPQLLAEGVGLGLAGCAASPPAWRTARYGTDFRAEATWYGRRDAACGQCIVTISPTFSLQMHHAWTKEVFMDEGSYWERYTAPFAITATVPPIKFVTNW